jgi:hypothetical protein
MTKETKMKMVVTTRSNYQLAECPIHSEDEIKLQADFYRKKFDCVLNPIIYVVTTTVINDIKIV